MKGESALGKDKVLEQAKEVLKIEAHGILGLMDRLGIEFIRAVEMILKAKGRVILTGMGKSGLIARKIAATLNSTGTPSLFLHPAEAIHGDLGMVTSDDIILAISNSGETPEISSLLPILKQMGAGIISFTGSPASSMAGHSDVVIDVGVEREACPLGLAPTASTTAALAMGDALAVVLIKMRKFGKDDFRKFHPGGSLGERLAVKVKEIMLTGSNIPVVEAGSLVSDALEEIDRKRIGATLVKDREGRLCGIITDGDLRRALLKKKQIHTLLVDDIMTSNPKTIEQDKTAAEALALMELYGITHLAIVDKARRIMGIAHLHDILGREEFRINGGLRRSSRTDR